MDCGLQNKGVISASGVQWFYPGVSDRELKPVTDFPCTHFSFLNHINGFIAKSL